MPAGLTYEPLSTTTISGTASTVTFSSIPSTYTDLVLVVEGQNNAGGDSNLWIRLNSDTGANYSVTYFQGTGSSVSSSAFTRADSFANVGKMSTSTRSINTLHFMNYSSSSSAKSFLCRFSNASVVTGFSTAWWNSSSAITTIQVGNGNAENFVSSTTFTLYGIAAA